MLAFHNSRKFFPKHFNHVITVQIGALKPVIVLVLKVELIHCHFRFCQNCSSADPDQTAPYELGAPVAQRAKCWPTDLAVPRSSPA